jgi:hypothetical protein
MKKEFEKIVAVGEKITERMTFHQKIGVLNGGKA